MQTMQLAIVILARAEEASHWFGSAHLDLMLRHEVAIGKLDYFQMLILQNG